jgi:hypothetical protein
LLLDVTVVTVEEAGAEVVAAGWAGDVPGCEMAASWATAARLARVKHVPATAR